MSQNPTVSGVARRVIRTAVQLVMGGALTALAQLLVQHFGDNLGPQGIAYVLMGATLLTSAIQNYGEKQGWFPILLPNAHANAPAAAVTPAPKV